jgi:hypothetical protein
MNVQPSGFFESSAYKVDPRLCFVIMPFTRQWSDRVYGIIKQVLKRLNLKCIRADQVHGKIVLRDIWRQINEAAFVIADLTGHNPNVYYELGIAHTLGKDVIPISQTGGEIPFDQRAFRILFYDDTHGGYRVLSRELPQWVSALSYSASPQMLIKTGAVDTFNVWRKSSALVRLVAEDFSALQLTGINLSHAHLSETCLEATVLDSADLSQAVLIRAQMRNSSLKKSTLVGANLSEADLGSADFTGADLSGVIMLRAKLHNVRFTEADVRGLTIDQATFKRFPSAFQKSRNKTKIVIEK